MEVPAASRIVITRGFQQRLCPGLTPNPKRRDLGDGRGHRVLEICQGIFVPPAGQVMHLPHVYFRHTPAAWGTRQVPQGPHRSGSASWRVRRDSSFLIRVTGQQTELGVTTCPDTLQPCIQRCASKNWAGIQGQMWGLFRNSKKCFPSFSCE